MNSSLRTACLALLLFTTTSCAFTSTATSWNGMCDPEGNPVFLKTTTNIGINLLVFIPFLGNTTIDSMVNETTSRIAENGGTKVRTVQSSATNYSMAFWPFTLAVTPYVTELVMEYQPSKEEIAEVKAANATFEENHNARRDRDNSHIIPEGRR